MSADYLETLGIPLLRGRPLPPDEMRNGGAVLVNEALARAYFVGEDPLGQRVRFVDSIGSWSVIVGVIADTVVESLDERSPVSQLLQPLATPGFTSLLTASYIVATDQPPLTYVPAIRHIRDELDADVAMIQPETMEALGAARGDVSWMVVRQSGVAVVLGVALGLAGASVAGHALETQLFGVAWYDPLTYVAVAVMIIGLGVLASWIPAFRAASVSPVRLLG